MKLKIAQMHKKDQARLYDFIHFAWSVILSVVCVPAMLYTPRLCNFTFWQVVLFVSAMCLLMFDGGAFIEDLFTEWWHNQGFTSVYIPYTRRNS